MNRLLCFSSALWASGALIGAPRPAQADTHRMAVVVGNNAGGPTDKPLHYAEEDASKVADVLAQLGDVHPEDLFLLRGQGRAALRQVVDQVAQRVQEARRNPADRTVLVFYYSGHSDGEALELGRERLPYAELRAWLTGTKADVRVAVVDGCKSGALVQSKGGVRAAPFDIKLLDQLDAAGEALLTSSAADELALESREIRGSFFTHHFVSGLRGAADASGDGRITLSEAYQYAFDQTIAATASAGVRQHPGYEYRLTGKGELALTEISQPSAWLELPEGFERALVLLVRRDQVLAELSAGSARKIALAPGEYAVRAWKGTQCYVARATVAAGEAKRVSWSELQPVGAPQVASKGHAEEGELQGLGDLSPEGQAEYLSKYFSVGDTVLVTASSHNVTLSNSFEVNQGRYRKKIDEDDFFLEVGRADLAGSYRNRRIARHGLAIGGLAVGIGGTLIGLAQKKDCPDLDHCFNTPLVVSVSSIAAGLVMVAVGFSINPHPVEVDEVRRLADEYNVAMRRRLATPAAPAPKPREPQVTFFVAPSLSSSARGLTMGVAF